MNGIRCHFSGERNAKAAKRIQLLAALLATAALPLAVQTQVRPGSSAGALLYETHCSTCHTAQIHWRDKRLATDWTTLSAQVRRWQSNAGLRWTDEEIDEVTRYLNTTIYRFPEEGPRQKS